MTLFYFLSGIILYGLSIYMLLYCYYMAVNYLKFNCHKTISISAGVLLFLGLSVGLVLLLPLTLIWWTDLFGYFQEKRGTTYTVGILINLFLSLFATNKFGIRF